MLRSHIAVWASAFVLAFFLTGHYIFGPDPARIVVTCLAIGMHFAVCLNWLGRFVSALRSGIQNGAQNIFVGIFLESFVVMAYSIWVVYLISEGRPLWARESPIGGLFYVGFFLASASLMVAPLNTRERIESVSFRWWIAAFGAGCVLAGSLMTLAFVGILHIPG